MARIRRVEIDNFRCVQKLRWNPTDGINCLIGPGDAGKSSILDAIGRTNPKPPLLQGDQIDTSGDDIAPQIAR